MSSGVPGNIRKIGDCRWYERWIYNLGLIPEEMLTQHKAYSFGFYLASFLVALTIGLSCAFVIGYFMMISAGLWIALPIASSTLVLNCYLYFADTLEFLHTLMTSESFFAELKGSCGPKGTSNQKKTDVVKNEGFYYYLTLSFLTPDQLYAVKLFGLLLIFVVVTADGIANAALALKGATDFFMTVGLIGLAAGPLPYLFALASLIGNAALIFMTLRAVLLDPSAVWKFIKEVFVPPLKDGEKADWKYAIKCAFRSISFLASLVLVSVATIAIAAVWKKDFGAFLVASLGLADVLASKIAIVVVWGLGLLPELAFAWKCAAIISVQIVDLFEKIVNCKATYRQWIADNKLQNAPDLNKVWKMLCVFGTFLFKATLILLNAKGNSVLATKGGLKLIPKNLVVVSGNVNSAAAMSKNLEVLGPPPKLGEKDEQQNTHESFQNNKSP